MLFPAAYWGQQLAVGLLYLPFALPFVLAGSLLGWGLQQVLPRRGLLLVALVALAGGGGMWLWTQSLPIVVMAVCSAAAGAAVAENEGAWRRWWQVVLLAAGVALGVVIFFRSIPGR